MEDFNTWKERGNRLFRDTYLDHNLAVCVYQMRMSRAIQFYNKALPFASNDKDRASVWKNLAVTYFRIGEHIYYSPKLLSESAIEQRDQDILFFLKESLNHFASALRKGLREHGVKWAAHLRARRYTCAELLWGQFILSNKGRGFHFLASRLHQFCWSLDRSKMRSEFFLRLAKLTFQKAVRYQESENYKESLQLLHDNHLAIEEAKNFLNDDEDVKDLEQSNFTYICLGEAAIARRRGEELLKTASVFSDDERKMELIWDVVDCYKQSFISSGDMCIESQAIAHCELGKVYGSIHIRQKSREHYKAAVDLELAMRPRNLTNRSWYKEALAGLEKYQQEDRWMETKEREKFRAPIRAEMKETLDELQRVSRKSTSELIDLIYDKHPPKRGVKSNNPDLKQKLKFALLHYHPDKQDLESQGLKWVVLTEEITVHLTDHLSRLKL